MARLLSLAAAAVALSQAHVNYNLVPAPLPSLGAAPKILANSTLLSWAGRTRVNSDGSRSFDWPGVGVTFEVAGASWVTMTANATGAQTRVRVTVDDVDLYSFAVLPQDDAAPPYMVAFGMDSNAGVTHTITVRQVMEPSYINGGSGAGNVALVGFDTDGQFVAPPAPRSRRLEFVGDSITVGYGSLGHGPCNAGWVSNDNSRTYDSFLCANFSANCSIIAWSGKGMYENCCDAGTKMPEYFLRALGGNEGSTWDFSAFVPDALVINLGTNDWGHYNGSAYAAAFTATYVEFLVSAVVVGSWEAVSAPACHPREMAPRPKLRH
jgi:hypothetical protein